MNNIHIVCPFRPDKNLGRAYNEAFEKCPDGDWLCLTDYDTCFLTPDFYNIMQGYVNNFPDAGILTCYTNRLHKGAYDQLLFGIVDEDGDIRKHIIKAISVQKNEGVFEINHVISGFLMLISKETWKQIKFNEDMKCLGVDNDYAQKILDVRKKIYRMNSLYVFHIYRMLSGVNDKSHLK